MKNRMLLIGIMTIISLWLAGCSKGKNNKTASDRAFQVKVQELTLSHEDNQNYYVGIVEESISVPTSFLTTGQVLKVYVSEGQKIKKGQLMAELDNSNYQNMYQMSLAKETQAEDAYKRLSDLYKKGSLPEIKFIEIQSGVEQARSATKIALKNLNDCKLFAPMDGIVGKRSIEPGMSIAPSIIAFKLIKIDKVYIKVSIPENEISKIRVGQTAQAKVAALFGDEFTGNIEEKGVLANPLSHTYDIKIAISNIDEKLKPGMVANVYLQNEAKSHFIVVPNTAIISGDNGKKLVYVVDETGNMAIEKEILIDDVRNNGIIVKAGLKSGEKLIVEGCHKLYNNAHVIINQ